MNRINNRTDLLALHDKMCKDARAIMEQKNHDYAGGGGPLQNFEDCRILGVEPEIGLMMRCIDKFKRVQTFVQSGTLKVKDEDATASTSDILNYTVLLTALLINRIVDGQDVAPAAKSEPDYSKYKEYSERTKLLAALTTDRRQMFDLGKWHIKDWGYGDEVRLEPYHDSWLVRLHKEADHLARSWFVMNRFSDGLGHISTSYGLYETKQKAIDALIEATHNGTSG